MTYYINRRCKAHLLWGFWFDYAESSYYEDPSLENSFYENLTTPQDWVCYSETTIIKMEDVARRGQNYPNGYRQSDERLDFYVTKPEFAEAYRAVQRLGRRRGTEQILEVSIFGSLRVVLLPDAGFGERSESKRASVHRHPSASVGDKGASGQ